MTKQAFGALCIGVLCMTACGGGGDHVDSMIVHTDGGRDGGAVCNVAVNTGCATGEKCTWIRVSVGQMPDQQLGQIGCAPEGNVDTGGSCMWGTSGIATGFDNCLGGNVCLAPRTAENATGLCKQICSVLDTSNECPTDFACARYQKYFTNGGMNEVTQAGICDPTCNPLTQERDSDGAPWCGDSTPTDQTDPGSLACFGLPSRDTHPTHFSCASIQDEDPNTAGIQNNSGPGAVPVNSCLNCCQPGNAPLYVESSLVGGDYVCMPVCDPADTDNTRPNNAGGDLTTGVDEAGAPDPGRWTCPRLGVGSVTFECRYTWWWEGFLSGNPPLSDTVPISEASNAYGFCIDPTQYTNDNTPTGTIWTQCREAVPSTDPAAPADGSARWGCITSDQVQQKPGARLMEMLSASPIQAPPDITAKTF